MAKPGLITGLFIVILLFLCVVLCIWRIRRRRRKNAHREFGLDFSEKKFKRSLEAQAQIDSIFADNDDDDIDVNLSEKELAALEALERDFAGGNYDDDDEILEDMEKQEKVQTVRNDTNDADDQLDAALHEVVADDTKIMASDSHVIDMDEIDVDNEEFDE